MSTVRSVKRISTQDNKLNDLNLATEMLTNGIHGYIKTPSSLARFIGLDWRTFVVPWVAHCIIRKNAKLKKNTYTPFALLLCPKHVCIIGGVYVIDQTATKIAFVRARYVLTTDLINSRSTSNAKNIQSVCVDGLRQISDRWERARKTNLRHLHWIHRVIWKVLILGSSDREQLPRRRVQSLLVAMPR